MLCGLISAAPMEPKVSFHIESGKWRGDSTHLVVHVGLPEGWHIQSSVPLDSFLVPTTLQMEGKDLVFGNPVFPKPVLEDFPALGGPVALYHGDFEIRVPVKRGSKKTGIDALKTAKVILHYQACNKTQCLPPREVVVRFDSLYRK